MSSLFMPHSGGAHDFHHWSMLHRAEGYFVMESSLMDDVVNVCNEHPQKVPLQSAKQCKCYTARVRPVSANYQPGTRTVLDIQALAGC